MPRIQPLNSNEFDDRIAPKLEAVKKKYGSIPNILSTMARSPAVLEAYLGFGQAMARSSLSGALREQIAIAVAGANGCGYCAAAHNAGAQQLKVSEEDRRLSLEGESTDPTTRAALRFVRKIVERRGMVDDDDVSAVRDAGFDDAAILELIAAVAMNIFSNYFNHIVETEVDFPQVKMPQAIVD